MTYYHGQRSMEKRILPSERAKDGACAACGRRHIHRDDCATLKRREDLRPRRMPRSPERKEPTQDEVAT